MQEYLNRMTPNELQVLFYVALAVIALILTALFKLLYQLLRKEN